MEANEWIKASASAGGQCCVEVAFHSAGACTATESCVQVAQDGDMYLVRDSKLVDAQGVNISPVLAFDRAEWDAFKDGVRNDEF